MHDRKPSSRAWPITFSTSSSCHTPQSPFASVTPHTCQSDQGAHFPFGRQSACHTPHPPVSPGHSSHLQSASVTVFHDEQRLHLLPDCHHTRCGPANQRRDDNGCIGRGPGSRCSILHGRCWMYSIHSMYSRYCRYNGCFPGGRDPCCRCRRRRGRSGLTLLAVPSATASSSSSSSSSATAAADSAATTADIIEGPSPALDAVAVLAGEGMERRDDVLVPQRQGQAGLEERLGVVRARTRGDALSVGSRRVWGRGGSRCDALA